MKVVSGKNGNYHEIRHNGGEFLQSYNAIVAYRKNGEIYLDSRFYDYSQTTRKHRNRFLGVSGKEFHEWRKDGKFTFVENLEKMIETDMIGENDDN